MTMETVFVVQPFGETNRGALIALPPLSARDADHVQRLMSYQKSVAVGVIAFSRRGDPETGDYENAVVLSRWGKVPDDDDMANAAA